MVLEAELTRRNTAIRELKEDVDKAVQLNIENAAKVQRSLISWPTQQLRSCSSKKSCRSSS